MYFPEKHEQRQTFRTVHAYVNDPIAFPRHPSCDKGALLRRGRHCRTLQGTHGSRVTDTGIVHTLGGG